MNAAPVPTHRPSDASEPETRDASTVPEVQAEQEPAAGLPRLPLLEDELDHPPVEVKPLWRGWLHAATFPIAIAAGIALALVARG